MLVYGLAQVVDGSPLRCRVGLCHARRFVDARHAHVVLKGDFTFVHGATHGRSAAGLRCAGHGDVAFTGQQARGRVQSDPACARQKHLAPGMQVGEVGLGTTGAIQRLDVGL